MPQYAIVKHQPLIDKIYQLESLLGEKYPHTFLEPFTFDSSDPIAVQKAAKKISEFIGIYDLTFIISYSTQKKNVGGHIELGNSKEVFIEIDNRYKHNCNAVLYILSHEICHKYLQINRIQLFPELENEILTDTATFYTGLGKLTLNGCEYTTTHTQNEVNGTSTSTTTYKLGYLSRQQFAFLYKMICQMRSVPLTAQKNLLSQSVLNDLLIIERDFDFCFNAKFFDNNLLVNDINNKFKPKMEDLQKKLSTIHRDIKTIKYIIVPYLSQIEKELHVYCSDTLGKLISDAHQKHTKNSLNYIKNLKLQLEIAETTNNIIKKTEELNKIPLNWSEVVSKVSQIKLNNKDSQTLEILFQFKCPLCDHEMRISEKKLARVKCGRCSYSFIVDTGVEPKENENENEVSSSKTEDGFFSKIKSIFK